MGYMRVSHQRFGTGVAIAVLSVLSAGCADNPTAPTASLNEAFVLGVGDVVRIEDQQFSIRFDGVAGDSRCPADALCILGGDATVNVTVTPSRGSRAHLELHTASPRSVQYRSFTLTLEQLAPYPFSSQPIDPSTYEVTIRVTR
ncbi:MAG: hypothetical protein AB7N65_14370 [Vicinamibacterales bacterium]